MAQQLPSARLVGFEELCDIERRHLIWKARSGDQDVEVLPGERVIMTIERPRRKDYNLHSLNHAMSYAPLRRSLRKICKMYRKVKRTNCIVRCYLKTTEVVLREALETCEPCLNFPIDTIDAITLICMNCVEEMVANPLNQVVPIANRYKRLIQDDIEYRRFFLKDLALDCLRDMIGFCMNCIPESWVPEPFIETPPMNVYHVVLDLNELYPL